MFLKFFFFSITFVSLSNTLSIISMFKVSSNNLCSRVESASSRIHLLYSNKNDSLFPREPFTEQLHKTKNKPHNVGLTTYPWGRKLTFSFLDDIG